MDPVSAALPQNLRRIFVATLEQRGRTAASGTRAELQDFRIGRIKHERVKVPRGEQIFNWGINVMKTHADKKSILEVEFLDEEGTGQCCNEDSSKIYVEGSVSDLLAHPKQRTYTMFCKMACC